MNSNNNKLYPFSDIKSNKAKNLLRGIIRNDNPSDVRKALKRIKGSCSHSDYINSMETLRENVLFENNSVLRNFIQFCPNLMDEVEVVSTNKIIENINFHAPKLIEISETYIYILDLIYDEKLAPAIKCIDDLIEKKGLSIFLIRMLFFIKNNIDNINEFANVASAIDDVFYKISLKNSKSLNVAIKELSNPRIDYFNLYKRISDINVDSVLNLIIKSFIFNIPKTKECFDRTLSAYYNFSLMDAFLYIASTMRATSSFTNNNVGLETSLMDSFDKLSRFKISDSPLVNKNEDVDNFFRESFLLIELNECFHYKTVHASLYNKNPNKFFEMTAYERSLINNYFDGVNVLKDLCFKQEDILNVGKFNSNGCTLLENSTALVYVLDKLGGDISGEEEEFVQLMSTTKEIGLICPEDYLVNINENVELDGTKLVTACLISIANKTNLAEHSLRRVIQKVTLNQHKSLLKLIQYVYTISPSVTEHLIQICDETFISKLFDLTEKPISAIEERARILEWYGVEIGDLAFEERAKNLKIDVQISKQKEAIDDSRIYADPVKFTQWVSDNCLDKITIQLEEFDMFYEKTLPSIHWNDVHSGLSSENLIGSYLLACYSEFCGNNLFGIASYLGRRIRHGTLEGTGTKEIKDFHAKDKYKSLFDHKDFDEYFRSWFAEYEDMLEELKLDYLHINDRKFSKGMIYGSFNTGAKITIANNMFKDVCNSFYLHENAIQIPYILSDYCWRCVEVDLISIKKFLGVLRAKYGVFSYDSKGLERFERKLVQEFCKEINSITTEKFRKISSWFNKPSIASPSANIVLLFKAVVSEVKDHVIGFDPDSKLDLDENRYIISGGIYFVIYDALSVLIYNAAKHGKKHGVIDFLIDEHFSETSIKLSVVSEVDDNSVLLSAEQKINQYLEESFENAHVIEGASGIKKLRQMECDEYISNVSYSFSRDKDKNLITASFDFNVSYR